MSYPRVVRGRVVGANPEPKREGVNLNTATADELTTISGIGPGKAKAIINSRNANGSFKSLEDCAMRVMKLKAETLQGKAYT